MIDLDPNLVDQDSIRKKRRKKLFLIAGGPIIVLFIASLFFIRTSLFNFLFGINYPTATDGGALVPLAKIQKIGNILEPYIAPYNLGTAFIKDGKWEDAESELHESLELNPPEEQICHVRVNLSYSIEMQADEKVNAGKYEDSLLLYNKAEGVLYDGGCASRDTSENGKDENADDARDRISKKRNNAVSKMNGDDGGDDDGDDGDGGEGEQKEREINEQQLRQIEDFVASPGDSGNYYYRYEHRDHSWNDHW